MLTLQRSHPTYGLPEYWFWDGYIPTVLTLCVFSGSGSTVN